MVFRTIFIENPCRLNYQSGYMVVRKQDGTTKIHLSEISSVVLQTQRVYVSAYLLAELAKSKISFVVSDSTCNPIGQYLALYGANNTSKRIQEQLAWKEPIKKRVWQHVVKDKIARQAELVAKQRHDVAQKLLAMIPEVRSGDTSMREACAARIYFPALFGQDFNRDDADSPINAALDFGYAILLSLVNREVVSHGFLTQCGICHRNVYNRFNLSCDFMEPFRPFVDQLVLDCNPDVLDKDTKRALGNIENQVLQYKGGSYKLRSVVSLYVNDCLNALNKKIPVDKIESFSFYDGQKNKD